MNETIIYLQNLLKNHDKIVLGLSGGPDSMCLLDILLKLPLKLEIICVHINHNIRKESIEEASFVQEYCQKKKVKFITTTFEKKSSTSNYNEQELREKRYKYFETIIKEENANYLFTAHHADDLIETILMRINRGSNLKGYSGFKILTEKSNYELVRPLIFSTKKEIEEYNKKNKIPCVIDSSNNTDNYTRNRIRHNILPYLKQENENVHLKYLKFSKELQSYYNFVDNIVKEELKSRYQNNELNIENFNKLDQLIQRKIIETILDFNYPDNLYLVQDIHVDHIIDLINNPKPNITLDLPNNIRTIKSYNKLRIVQNKKEVETYKIKLEEKTLLPNNHYIEKLKESNNTSNYCIRLNSKELKMPLYVRTRQSSDKMIIKNMTSAKKIKDIFINSKLSIEERNTQPIVVDSNDMIIWLPGLKKSKFDKAFNENYDIILWYN